MRPPRALSISDLTKVQRRRQISYHSSLTQGSRREPCGADGHRQREDISATSPGRRVLGPSLATMSLKWRWCLFVVIATAVFGGFIPNGPHPTALQPSRTVTLLAEELPIGPISCFGAWCNKGTPTPMTPPLSIAAVGATTAGVLAYAVTRSARRIRPKVAPLPEGNPTVPFRPPQFS
jgi:hypothetical protein